MVRTPSNKTLQRYGLSLDEWHKLVCLQQGVCYVCEALPTSGRLCIDHEHVLRWSKLPPAMRKLYVRGLLCWRCNTTFVGRSATVRRCRRAAEYLERYEAGKPDEQSKTGPG
jgi:hypothetical protein